MYLTPYFLKNNKSRNYTTDNARGMLQSVTMNQKNI